MNKKLKELCDQLESEIKNAYEGNVTLSQAEQLSSQFLYAQLQIAAELQVVDLDKRMKKTGVKAIKAAVYLENAAKGDKKPSDVMLNAMVDVDSIVTGEQEKLDTSEVESEYLERCYNVFKEAHIYFRGLAKSTYNG